MMNYKAQGAPKMGRNSPRHSDDNTPGSDQDAFDKRSGGRPSKAELIARMKKAQDERSKEGDTES